MEPKSENNSNVHVCSNNSTQYTDCSVSGSLVLFPVHWIYLIALEWMRWIDILLYLISLYVVLKKK